MRNVQQKLAIARGEQPAELLFKNARLVNVLSGEIHPASVAVDDGRVIGIGDYRAKKIIDLKGAYLAPSLIDGHFHVESSMLVAPEFARAVVPHGTGAVVIDPPNTRTSSASTASATFWNPRKICRWIFSSCCRAAFPRRTSKPPARG